MSAKDIASNAKLPGCLLDRYGERLRRFVGNFLPDASSFGYDASPFASLASPSGSAASGARLIVPFRAMQERSDAAEIAGASGLVQT